VDDSVAHASFVMTPAGMEAMNVTGTCEDGYQGTPWRLCYPNGIWSATESPCHGTSAGSS